MGEALGGMRTRVECGRVRKGELAERRTLMVTQRERGELEGEGK